MCCHNSQPGTTGQDTQGTQSKPGTTETGTAQNTGTTDTQG